MARNRDLKSNIPHFYESAQLSLIKTILKCVDLQCKQNETIAFIVCRFK